MDHSRRQVGLFWNKTRQLTAIVYFMARHLLEFAITSIKNVYGRIKNYLTSTADMPQLDELDVEERVKTRFIFLGAKSFREILFGRNDGYQKYSDDQYADDQDEDDWNDLWNASDLN